MLKMSLRLVPQLNNALPFSTLS